MVNPTPFGRGNTGKRGGTTNVGKKAVYITPYRNLAMEVKEMYAKKGERAEVEAEQDSTGHPVFVVYVYPL